MKILLLQDVKKIGRKGEIADVSDGYARNFIIPRKLGRESTSGDQKISQMASLRQEEHLLKKAKEANLILDKIKDTSVVVEVKTNEKGGLFSTLKKSDILDAIEKSCGEKIPEDILGELLDYKDSIKEIGEYSVECFFEKRRVTVNLVVKPKK